MRFLKSTDHKTIGLSWLIASGVFLGAGLGLAVLMRLQQGFPGRGWMVPETYAMLFTLHATLMVFFAVVPALLWGFGNYLVPLLIGARRMAFPRMLRTAFWLFLGAGVLLVVSCLVPGGAAKSGWFAYPPLSVVEPFGQTLWLIALLLWIASGILAAINLIVTIVNHRTPGMRWTRLPVSVWSVFLANAMALAAFPALVVACAALLADRLGWSHFFVPPNVVIGARTLGGPGGTPLLWQHLFWFFGHPVVYILILPAMGYISDILPVFSRRPLFGYRGVVAAQIGIAVLSFMVWGHHMVVSGLNPWLSTGFMLTTILIALPSAVELFSWLATLWRGSIRFSAAMLCVLGFLSLFIVGGLTGVLLALAPVDVHLHSTAFITAHFHYVMAGSALYGILAALYYWFPKMTGRMLSESIGRWHVIATFLFFNVAFYPIFILGLAGEPRRMFDVSVYPALAALQGLRTLAAWGAFALAVAQVLWVWNMIRSLLRGARSSHNPWDAATLEWITTSPPPEHNFDVIPLVNYGPHDFTSSAAKR